MMVETSSFDDFMNRVQCGDDVAAEELFDRYLEKLVRLARNHLDSRVKHKVEPEDVAQSTLKSFFQWERKEKTVVNGWDGLWAFLAVIAVRKCEKKTRYWRTAKRSIYRESDRLPDVNAIDDGPTPLQAAALVETVETLMSGLDQRDRQIVTLSLQGYLIREISTELSRSESTVRRVLKAVRKRLEFILNNQDH